VPPNFCTTRAKGACAVAPRDERVNSLARGGILSPFVADGCISRSAVAPLATYTLTSLALLVFLALAGVVVVALARRAGVGKAQGSLALVDRLRIDAKVTVYVVRAGNRAHVFCSSGGSLLKLDEGDPSHFPAPPPLGSPGVERVLERLAPRRWQPPRADGGES
jgi:hypothetical protein